MENTRIGPFQLLEKVGTNRRQKVFRAIQVEQQREVVLKFVKIPPNVAKARALSRIKRESKILRKLLHPNLVQVYGAGIEEPNIFFAMEMVHGESLSKVLTRRGRLAWDLAVEYAKQIAQVLDYIHGQDIIHLKLTPEKILIREDGTVKVTDLRLNRSRKRRWDNKSSDRAMEAAAYMPPEQLVGESGTAKSDFYSLGVILYEMLTGKLPHPPATMAQMIEAKQTQSPTPISDHSLNCPIWLEKIVQQLLRIDPAQRPHTAKAIVLALQEVQEIDSSGTGVAEKLTGTFNPLIAGVDKSEARKLLGYKEPKAATTPFYQKTWFQIGALFCSLLLIAGFLGWMLRPPTDAQLYVQARELVSSDSRDAWTTAKLNYIEPLMERGADRPYYQNCVSLLNTIEYKKLRERIKAGKRVRSGDTPNEKRLFSAQEYVLEENFPRALAILQRLVKNVSTDGPDGYISQLANDMEQEILLEMDRRRIEGLADADGEDGDDDAVVTKEEILDEPTDSSAEDSATNLKVDSKRNDAPRDASQPSLEQPALKSPVDVESAPTPEKEPAADGAEVEDSASIRAAARVPAVKTSANRPTTYRTRHPDAPDSGASSEVAPAIPQPSGN